MNELRKGPSGPLAVSDGVGRLMLEQYTVSLPDGLAATPLVSATMILPDFNPVTSAGVPASPVNFSAQFNDAKAGDLIQITGRLSLLGPTATTASVLRFELAQGGTIAAPPTVFAPIPQAQVSKVGNNTTPLPNDIGFAFWGQITTSGVAIVRAALSATGTAGGGNPNVTALTNQATALKQGLLVTFSRFGNINAA